MYPYWITYNIEDYPAPGDTTVMVHNAAADTDMGDLCGEEFSQYFPHAREITKHEFEERI